MAGGSTGRGEWRREWDTLRTLGISLVTGVSFVLMRPHWVAAEWGTGHQKTGPFQEPGFSAPPPFSREDRLDRELKTH